MRPVLPKTTSLLQYKHVWPQIPINLINERNIPIKNHIYTIIDKAIIIIINMLLLGILSVSTRFPNKPRELIFYKLNRDKIIIIKPNYSIITNRFATVSLNDLFDCLRDSEEMLFRILDI